MVASSSNLMLLASTHVGNHLHVRNNSTIPNDHDALPQMDPTMNRGFMIRSNSNNNIRGSTGNLKDMLMLETVMAPTPTATYPIKNGGSFSMASNDSCSKKKNRGMSGGNLKNLLYVLEPLTTPSLPVIASASASASASTDDDWFLDDEEEVIFSDDEEEEDIITPITIETTTCPADTIIATPSTPGRKPSPSPSPQKKEEKKIASIRVETMKMKMKDTTIRIPVIENRSSIGSSSSSSSFSFMGSSNLKDIMLETAALSSASGSSLRSSRSTSTSSPAPVPAPAPTLNATWSTNTSIKALKSMHRFFSVPLSAPKMPDIFSCGGTTGTTTSFDHQKVKKDFTKKMCSCTTSTPIHKKQNHHEQDVNVHLGRRLNDVKKYLFLQLNLPSTSSQKEEEEYSGRTAATASSTCSMSSPEEQEEEGEEIFFGMETTKLSPRIMMFYQEDDNDDDDDDSMMMMAPSSASRLSFYNQKQEEQQEEEQEEEVTPDVNHNTPSPASNLSLLTNIALSLASPASNDTKDDDDDDNDDDDNDYGIFLSFSDDDDNENQTYNKCASSPSLKYNDYAFHNSKTTLHRSIIWRY